MTPRVVGVDACQGGWLGVVLDGDTASARFAPTIEEVAAAAGPVEVVAIDIPIGLPEAHPEVSFAVLAGAPLRDAKTTWAGVEHRRRLLARAGVHLAGELGEAGRRARVDDVLDAAATAWTARRVAAGRAISLPDPPDTYRDGLPYAIWA